MRNNKYQQRGLWTLGALLLLLAVLAQAGWQVRQPTVAKPGTLAPSGAAPSTSTSSSTANAQDPVDVGNGIAVGQAYKHDISPNLRDIKPIPPSADRGEEEHENPPIVVPGRVKDQPDTVVQRGLNSPSPAIAAPLLVFSGIASTGAGGGGCNCAPPDTNGEIGPNHYVQTVNTAFQVFNRTGGSLYGPANINTIWSGFGGACQSRNDGDPVVLYDQLANRWLVSQFTAASPYNECIAISTTGDPTGSWYRYAFQLSTSDFPDYPHLGVWPDGYYMTVNWFIGGSIYGGPRPYVFNRSAMLNGQAATFQTTSAALGSSYAPMLPSDLDGSTPPPAGAANPFAEFGNPLNLYKFHVDWANPANSTFGSRTSLSVAGFTQLCTTTRNCISQPGVAQKLDGIGDRLMHRLAYRNLGDHESIVVNHSVNAVNGVAGVRWYEIRGATGTPTLYQQGTYSPDANNRWMGSAAMNGQGDLAVGYSVSSSSVYPSIRYAGRLAADPLGQLSQGEGSIYAANGSQSGVNRWGDYSALSVDPTDDCTFWYTQEYNESTNWYWRTKVGSFRVGACGAGGATPTPVATNTPTPIATNTSTPVATNTPVPTATSTPTPGTGAGDFSLTVAPTSLTVARGSTGQYTATLNSLNAFAGNVTLTVTGLPSKTSGSFSPNPVALSSGGTGTSTLTVKVNRPAARGTYTLTITGTSGNLTHSQTVTLIIQ